MAATADAAATSPCERIDTSIIYRIFFTSRSSRRKTAGTAWGGKWQAAQVPTKLRKGQWGLAFTNSRPRNLNFEIGISNLSRLSILRARTRNLCFAAGDLTGKARLN